MAVSGMSVFMVTAPFAARATAPPNTNADTPSLFEGTNDGTQMELSCVAQALRPQPSVAEKANFWPTITKPNAPPCGKRSGQRGDSTSPAGGRRLCYRTRRPCLARRLMLARGGSVRLGARPAGCRVFSRLRDSTEARIRLFCLRRRPLSGILPWRASAVDGRKNSAPDTLPGFFL